MIAAAPATTKKNKRSRRKYTAAERYERKCKRLEVLMTARETIADGAPRVIYTDDFTKNRCERIAGPIDSSTWSGWRGNALAKLDRGVIPYQTNSFATHVALITIAFHLAGNFQGEGEPRSRFNQLSKKKLAESLLYVSGADIHHWARKGELMPSHITQEELDAKIAEIHPKPPSRSTKYRAGWVVNGIYPRHKANEILRKLGHHEFTEEWQKGWQQRQSGQNKYKFC